MHVDLTNMTVVPCDDYWNARCMILLTWLWYSVLAGEKYADLTNMTVVLCVDWWNARWSEKYGLGTLCWLVERTPTWVLFSIQMIVEFASLDRNWYLQYVRYWYLNISTDRFFLLLDQIKCKKQNRKQNKNKNKPGTGEVRRTFTPDVLDPPKLHSPIQLRCVSDDLKGPYKPSKSKFCRTGREIDMKASNRTFKKIYIFYIFYYYFILGGWGVGGWHSIWFSISTLLL